MPEPIIYKTNHFGKEFKIINKKHIERLLQTEVAIKNYPFLVKIISSHEPLLEASAVQWLLIVSKKRFKLAVHRNRIRRRMREGIRLHQQDLCNHLRLADRAYYIALQYVGSFDASSLWIQDKMQQTLSLILQQAAREMGRE